MPRPSVLRRTARLGGRVVIRRGLYANFRAGPACRLKLPPAFSAPVADLGTERGHRGLRTRKRANIAEPPSAVGTGDYLRHDNRTVIGRAWARYCAVGRSHDPREAPHMAGGARRGPNVRLCLDCSQVASGHRRVVARARTCTCDLSRVKAKQSLPLPAEMFCYLRKYTSVVRIAYPCLAPSRGQPRTPGRGHDAVIFSAVEIASHSRLRQFHLLSCDDSSPQRPRLVAGELPPKVDRRGAHSG
jgi:hypothetical protein